MARKDGKYWLAYIFNGESVSLKDFPFIGSLLTHHFSDLYANMLMHAN